MRVHRIGFAAIKGTRHLSRPSADLTATGVVGDRMCAVADPTTHLVLRTVDHPLLARVEATALGSRLTLRLPDGSEVTGSTERVGSPVTGDYWGRPAPLHPLDGALDGFVAALLQRPAVVVAVDPGDVVWGAPVSIVTTGALARLAQDLRSAGRDVPDDLAERFRSTLTLDAEEDPAPGSRLRVGDALLEVVGPIDRCAVIDADPRTGRRGSGLLTSLGLERGAPVFGVDARVIEPGTVRPGDAVTISAVEPVG